MPNDYRNPWPYRVAEFAENYWREITRDIGTALLVLATFATSDEVASNFVPEKLLGGFRMIAIIAVVVLIAIQIWMAILSYKHTERVSDLRKERDALMAKRELRAMEVKPMIFAYLKMIGERDFEIGAKSEEVARLTLYLHDSDRSCFVPVSRFSNSPELSEIARTEYPDSQGCLRRVWVEGVYYTDKYPSYSRRDEYIAQCIADNVPEEVVQNLRMKPALYAGAAIWNQLRSRQVGVLLLEATNPGRYPTTATLERLRKEEKGGYLAVLIDALD